MTLCVLFSLSLCLSLSLSLSLCVSLILSLPLSPFSLFLSLSLSLSLSLFLFLSLSLSLFLSLFLFLSLSRSRSRSLSLSLSLSVSLCQCSISLPDAGVHVSIRISRLYLRVYVLCTYRRTDLRPLVWNVAVCTACCSNNRNTHTHRCNVAVGCISLRRVATPVKYNHNSIENFAILSS